MRQKLKAGILLFLLSIIFTIPAYAGSTDTWLNGWEYSINGGNVLLKSYTGDGIDLDIYGRATVNGTKYNTVIYYDGSVSPFTGNEVIRSISFHAVDGQKVRGSTTKMDKFFRKMTSLEEVSFSDGFDTSGVTSLTAMFFGCNALRSVDAENLDLSSATTLNSMFGSCGSLESIELPDDLSSLEVMSYMFDGCSSLKSLDLSGKSWRSWGVYMSQMIYRCPNLAELIVDENVNVGSTMFTFCGESSPTKIKIIGRMSSGFESYVYSMLKDGNRYIEALDVRAGVTLVGDEAYDYLSYGLKLSDGRSEKIQDNDGSDSIYFNAYDNGIYIYKPGEYTLTLTQGLRVTDESTGNVTVEGISENDDGFRCENSTLTKTINVTRNDDGSISIEEV
ncbi:MAG: BspA family leucine-rich repeat surface protein [Lachnospiraceae bacterium]|nr:BspA family leucine-rich repeat surface protein [Lachnospiraceae bacterium]